MSEKKKKKRLGLTAKEADHYASAEYARKTREMVEDLRQEVRLHDDWAHWAEPEKESWWQRLWTRGRG